MITEDQQRILDRSTVLHTGCWVWNLKPNDCGYGVLHVGDKTWKAHIFSYVAFIGPVPTGLELDHLCRVRACVNPWHVEPVTHLINMARAIINRGIHCIHNHEFTLKNTYFYKGKRRCKACNRRSNREFYGRASSLRLIKLQLVNKTQENVQ